MKTMFTVAPFGHLAFGNFSPPPVYPALGNLGQAPSSPGDLSQGIESMLSEVPPQALGPYQTEYQNCQNLLNKGGLVGMATGGQCLYDLYTKLQLAVKGKTPLPTATSSGTPMPYTPPESGFPAMAVVLGLAGVAALIYAYTQLS